MYIRLATTLEKLGIQQFDGKNFDNWKQFRIMAVLDQQDVKECVVTYPGNKSEAFLRKDKKCKNIIIGCLSDAYLEFVKDKDTAYTMWNALEQQFERQSIASQNYWV
ncbi:form3 [Trypoxylus dichotomus]